MGIWYHQLINNHEETVISRVDQSHLSICKSSRHYYDIGNKNWWILFSFLCLLCLAYAYSVYEHIHYKTMSGIRLGDLFYGRCHQNIQLILPILANHPSYIPTPITLHIFQLQCHVSIDLKAWWRLGPISWIIC